MGLPSSIRTKSFRSRFLKFIPLRFILWGLFHSTSWRRVETYSSAVSSDFQYERLTNDRAGKTRCRVAKFWRLNWFELASLMLWHPWSNPNFKSGIDRGHSMLLDKVIRRGCDSDLILEWNSMYLGSVFSEYCYCAQDGRVTLPEAIQPYWEMEKQEPSCLAAMKQDVKGVSKWSCRAYYGCGGFEICHVDAPVIGRIVAHDVGPN